jgi:hypothetical protein
MQKDITKVTFGSGGGFTGEVVSYELSSNGKLSVIKNKQAVFVKDIPKNKTRELFKKAENLKSYEFNTPDNLSSFLEINFKGSTKRIVWGEGSSAISKDVTSLYNDLNNLIK